MPEKYGIVASNNSAKLARTQVARWNDNVKRHTVYTVVDSGQDNWGVYRDPGTVTGRNALVNLGKNVTGNANYTWTTNDGDDLPDWAADPSAVVGRAATTTLFNWVPVSYPAFSLGSAPSLERNWVTEKFSVADSVAYGVAELISLIKGNPGTFALVGTGQGAIVISQVLQSILPGGSLASRYNDCIGAISFGNPCRKAGSTFPGGTNPGGAGLMAGIASGSLTGLSKVSLPSWWYEFATPNDLFATAPTDGPAGPLLTSVASSLGNFKGGGELTSFVLTNLRSAFLISSTPVMTSALRGATSALSGTQNTTTWGAVRTWLNTQVAQSVNPHMLYGKLKPTTLPTGLAGVNSNSTFIQVATAYLNARGAAVVAR